VPDLFVLHRGIAYMVEIKAEVGVLSDVQRSVAAAVLAASGRVGVARDADEALACLEARGTTEPVSLYLAAATGSIRCSYGVPGCIA
jgi:hypothetical protein